jgi:HD-GYP domain-containing protein (c-di-GMP phosphodiesterase class II)
MCAHLCCCAGGERTGQLKQAVSDLERSFDITLETLGDALDFKDAEPQGHSKRVTVFTIARAMRLPQEQIRVIARGAFLHDIGLLAIPDSIVHKPGDLTQKEFAIMQEHCYRGYQIPRKIPFLAEATDIVYAHEERWNGTGYPRGLKGKEIPLGARLVSIAHTLDEITSDRPYQAAQPFSAAREEIIRWSGRQFDPDAVKIFLSIPEAIWHEMRKEIDQQIYRFNAYSQKATP